MKKVLIITYYWPPSGGAGVQRWLKFAKYLRHFGWEPLIYTPSNPEAPAEDASLLADIPGDLTILKTPIWEPYRAYKKFVGRKSSDTIKTGFLSERKKPSLAEQLAVWVRGNLFIPDARKHWIKPSIRYLKDYLERNPVEALVSTGPPHSMHLIAMQLKADTGIPWLADFRDPWTNIDFYQELKLTKRSDRLHRRMELEVLRNADEVVVISEGMKQDFKLILDRSYAVITNGFDDVPPGPDIPLDERFSIAHIGSLVPSRNPDVLWKALKELKEENREFDKMLEIKLIGQIDFSIRESIRKYGLEDNLITVEYLSHDEVLTVQRQAQVLLLLINNTPNAGLVLTGKVFEYIHAGRPILCIGPTGGNAAGILAETNTGLTLGYDDVKGLKMALLSYFIKFENKELIASPQNIQKYSRKNLTGDLAGVLNTIVSS